MLNEGVVKQINELVQAKPRTIQEIAQVIDKNWRTANSYVEKIAQDGSIAVRTFRGGTRGALKIVYWNSFNVHSSAFKEDIFRAIQQGRVKSDFSPFDIYQHVDEKKRHAYIEEKETMKNYALNSAQEQILFFSGNMSWINLNKMLGVIEEIAKKVPIKILTRLDIASLKNYQKINAINTKLGREAIEIRHCEQPLRGFILDKKQAMCKEDKNPTDYKGDELTKHALIFYEFYDVEWVEWLEKVFWNFFRTAIPASKRLKDLQSIHSIIEV